MLCACSCLLAVAAQSSLGPPFFFHPIFFCFFYVGRYICICMIPTFFPQGHCRALRVAYVFARDPAAGFVTNVSSDQLSDSPRAYCNVRQFFWRPAMYVVEEYLNPLAPPVLALSDRG